MQRLCLSRGEEDESRVNGGQQLFPVAMHTDSHIQGFQGLHMFCVPASCGSAVSPSSSIGDEFN